MNATTAAMATLMAVFLATGAFVVANNGDDVDLVTVEGTVTATFHNPVFDVTNEFVMETEAGVSYLIELGPPWYWAEQGGLPEITVGVNVTVTGEVGDDDGTIEAWEITVHFEDGDVTVTIKADGDAPWDGGPTDLPPVTIDIEVDVDGDTPPVDTPPVDVPEDDGEDDDGEPPIEVPPVETPPVDTPDGDDTED